MALGASRWQVMGMILRESAWLLGAGVLIGVPLAMGVGKAMGSLLFGLKPTDPLTLVTGVALLAAVAMAAAYIPARRAMKVNPMVALRYE